MLYQVLDNLYLGMNKWIDGWIGTWKDECMDGQIDGWINGDRWKVDVLYHIFIVISRKSAIHTERQTSLPSSSPPPSTPHTQVSLDMVYAYYIYYNYNNYIL